MNIRADIQQISKDAAQWRQMLHASPGIAYNEKFASQFVKGKLKEWNVQFESGWGVNEPDKSGAKTFKGSGGFGIVATLDGQLGSGETIGLRADMDALPIQENTGLKWKSKKKGVMHACGHDGHTATLLSVAKYFSKAANRNFSGQLKLIFQPAEEGAKGALKMINEGLFEKHPMDAVFAMHNWPDLPVGKIAVHSGAVMASSTYFDITLNGKSAHVGKFDQAQSTIKSAAEIISRMPISKRDGDPMSWHSTELTDVSIGAKAARGVIPGAGEMRGSIRTYDMNLLDSLKGDLEGLTKEFGASIVFNDGSPATINKPAQAAMVKTAAHATVGEANTIWNADPELTAEDFGFMLAQKEGCYFWVGQGDPDNQNSPHNKPLHNNEYDFNDDAIAIGAETFVNLVHARLG